MFGKTDFFPYVIFFIALIAFVSDIVWARIFNWITFPSLILGTVFSGYFLGWIGLGDSLLGIAVGFLLYGWLFWFKAIGGGDVKLLMAFGAWGGIKYAEQVGLLAIFLGGVMAVFVLLFKGKLPGFIKRMRTFFLSVFLRELQFSPPQIDQKLKMPFGIPITVAAVWVAFQNPFQKWGVPLW